MRRLLILFFTSLLFLATASNAWAATAPAFPEGWQIHHPILIRGGIHSGIQPFTSTSGYTPAQISHAYGVDQLANTGTGQTIAIIDAYGSPTISADLAVFDNQYSLPAANLTIAYPDGQPTIDPTSADEESWAEETSIDVEWSHALAPGANILLVVAASADDLFDAIQYANSLGPQIVSMSWGGPESGFSDESDESSYDSYYFSHTGTIYLAASGDYGAYSAQNPPQYPASSPNVIAVGGTTLPLDANGNLTGPETAWSGSSGSSGGGASLYETQPSWQTSFGIAGSHRSMPDVAFDADPNTGVNVYFDDSTFGKTAGWLTVGGTSLSVQCWAAIMALVDQGSPLTNASQALYKLAGAQSNFNPYGAYRDITSGSNGAHSAGPGYDLVTGLGSPVANALVPAVLTTPTIAPESGVYILPAVTVSISASLSVGQSVYYTTNGNQPTASSHMYSAPFTLPLSTGTTTVCAAVYSARSGLFGVVSEADYTGIASLAAPTIYPNSGSINSTQQITITDPNNFTGDSLYYTLDGTKPGLQSNLYTAPFTLSNSATVTAAVLNPTAGWSQSTSAVFTVAATSTAGGGGGGGSTAGGGGGGGGGGGAMAAAAPTVQTDSAQSITASSAILNGNIVSGGGANITEYGFLWGTSQDNLANTLQVGTDNHSGDFTATLSNLTGGTAYYFQAFAKNTSEADGTVMSFTTTGEPQTTTTSTISNTTTTTAPAFSDVQASYWAYDAISNLSRLDYITGYPDGSFKPDGTITRAEFVSILTRALKLQAYSPPVPGFTDVSSSDWFYSSVESSVHAGIASGNGSGSFSPNEPVTREEMATILVNALSKQDEAKASMSARTLFADDTSISSWARGFVVMAVNEGLIRGYPDNTFRPQGDATRAEACSMISSFLSIQK